MGTLKMIRVNMTDIIIQWKLTSEVSPFLRCIIHRILLPTPAYHPDNKCNVREIPVADVAILFVKKISKTPKDIGIFYPK